MAITPKAGGFANHHNHFTLDQFLHRDEETSNLHRRDGERVAWANEDWIVSLHQGLADKVDDAANTIMYKCGYNWGVQDMKSFGERMRTEYGEDKLTIWDMNRDFVLESWWWPMLSQGWGFWGLDDSMEEQGLKFITITNSVVAKSMEQVGKPVCHMYAGLFAGVFSVFDQVRRSAIEVQCYSMGNDRCKFLVGPEERVDAAQFWREEGATAEEIRKNLEQ